MKTASQKLHQSQLAPAANKFQVGKMYSVPAVEISKTAIGLDPGDFLPVIGPLHEDTEIIGFKHEHWHIDFRFVRKAWWEDWGSSYYGHAHVFGKVITSVDTTGVVTQRRMKCQRPMPTFPREIPYSDMKSIRVPWLTKLENAFADCTLKTCGVCPHRGIPLKDLPVRDGVVVCPGHGLAWDVTSGKLVRRVEQEATVCL